MGNPRWIQIYYPDGTEKVFALHRRALPLSGHVIKYIEINSITNTARLCDKNREPIAAFSGLPFVAVY